MSHDFPSARRILLPSGKRIEVLRPLDSDGPPGDELHVCPECASELVQPVGWSEAPGNRWRLTLHCPNCDWTVEGLYEADSVRRLEEQLDDGVARMLSDLKRIAHANMADRIDGFAQALQADLILPEDF